MVVESWADCQAAVLSRGITPAEMDRMSFDDFGALIGALSKDAKKTDEDGVPEVTQADIDADEQARQTIIAAREKAARNG